MVDFENRLCAQYQQLCIIKTFYMSQMNPKRCLHNTTLLGKLPDTPFKGTDVNETCSSLNGGLFEITRTVPFKRLVKF